MSCDLSLSLNLPRFSLSPLSFSLLPRSFNILPYFSDKLWSECEWYFEYINTNKLTQKKRTHFLHRIKSAPFHHRHSFPIWIVSLSVGIRWKSVSLSIGINLGNETTNNLKLTDSFSVTTTSPSSIVT